MMVKQIKTNIEIDNDSTMNLLIKIPCLSCGCFGFNCSCFRVH